MGYKSEIIKGCCDALKENLRFDKVKHTVSFISEFKPYNYYLPEMHIGSSLSISDKIPMAWFAEIYVDNKCIFRESLIPNEDDNLNNIEEVVIDRLLKNVFIYGVMSSKNNLERFS